MMLHAKYISRVTRGCYKEPASTKQYPVVWLALAYYHLLRIPELIDSSVNIMFSFSFVPYKRSCMGQLVLSRHLINWLYVLKGQVALLRLNPIHL